MNNIVLLCRAFVVAIGLWGVSACSGPVVSTAQNSPQANLTRTVPLAVNSGPEDKLLQSMGLVPIKDKPPISDFALEDLSGHRVKLSDYRGKMVLLNFWATWCPPCRLEMPSMEKLYGQFKDRPDFAMLAVDVQEDKDIVVSFLKEQNYTFPVLLDSTGEVGSIYGVRGIPTTFLIDKESRVVASIQGAHDWSSTAVLDGFNTLFATSKQAD